MVIHEAVDAGWDREVRLGEVMAMLHYPDGTWRFRHDCKEWFYDDGQAHRLVCAPELNGAHVIETEEPLTISPSILCLDCNTHGFVRNSLWAGC